MTTLYHRILSLFIFITLMATAAVADELESESLFRKGAWNVEITFDNEDNNFWCTASTSNRRSQSFSLTAFDDGNFMLMIGDPVWSIRPRSVRFLVDVDYSRWTIDGDADGSYVTLFMGDLDKTVKFIAEIMGGNAVAVLNDSGQRLATFSLNGSSAAVSNLMDCWKKIRNRDPFTNRTDPFGASSDPF